MVKREIKAHKYIISLLISVLIFTTGVLVGERMNFKQTEEFASELAERSLDLDSVQLHTTYVSFLLSQRGLDNTTTCKIIGKSIEADLKLLEKVEKKLDYFEGKDIFDSDYWRLKRDYTQSLFRLYILTETYRQMCGKKIVNILYFYTNPCDDCKVQSEILSKVQRSYKDDVFVYSFDASLEDKEPLISTLRYVYTVTTFPTIIIENNTFEGITDEQTLKSVIDKILSS